MIRAPSYFFVSCVPPRPTPTREGRGAEVTDERLRARRARVASRAPRAAERSEAIQRGTGKVERVT
ncbi:hypothetical protein Misp02_66930 [Microtetraspora sp. NBRC 16547]|nr:hypothetical protein Misp02_66930 [Microtetraspora sp. NBRC 16547]